MPAGTHNPFFPTVVRPSSQQVYARREEVAHTECDAEMDALLKSCQFQGGIPGYRGQSTLGNIRSRCVLPIARQTQLGEIVQQASKDGKIRINDVQCLHYDMDAKREKLRINHATSDWMRNFEVKKMLQYINRQRDAIVKLFDSPLLSYRQKSRWQNVVDVIRRIEVIALEPPQIEYDTAYDFNQRDLPVVYSWETLDDLRRLAVQLNDVGVALAGRAFTRALF